MIENDIPYHVLRVALTSHVGAPRWTRLIPTCTVSNHVRKMGKALVGQWYSKQNVQFSNIHVIC